MSASRGLRFAVRSDVGLLREGNEDAAYAGPSLLAVADGMGGHVAGEVASRLAIESIAGLEAAPDADPLAALQAGVDQAQDRIRERIAEQDALEGMGTTLTALLWGDGQLGLAHIGDSRAYRLRDGELARLTHDHTYVQELVDAGRITPAEADVHPQRSVLTRVLDGRSALDPDLSRLDARPGDRYLLCSDGLSGVVSDETIAGVLGQGDAEGAADRLVELALRGGGPDNVTVVVADVVDRGPDTATVPVVAGAAAAAAGAEDRAAEPVPPRRGRRWLLGIAALLLLAAAGTGGWLWLRSQYFLGVDGGQVAIFRGLDGSVGGIRLSQLAERRNVPVAVLPQYERERLSQGIPAPDLGAAQRIADRIATEACAPRPSPHPLPGTAPTPSPSAPDAPCPAAQP